MNTETKLKAALYSRVSSDEQANEGVSIEAQQAALKAYAKAMGWDVYECYVDGGFSGGTDNRPAFKRMLRDAGEKRFDIIATCKLDRFFRNLRLLLNYLYELEKLNIKFIATQEGLDTASPIGKFAVQMMGVIAEFERGRIGERVKDARHYLISKGNWPGGNTPYGYRWDNEKKEWRVESDEAAIVRKVYSLYLDDKLGMSAIADRLNQEGITTRKGFTWNQNKVRTILTHAAYKGQHPTGVAIPSIIDEKTWQRAQDQREKARSVQKAPKGWLLQGMVFCGHDGYAMRCLKKKAHDHPYYACRGRVDKNYKRKGSNCKLPYLRAERLEAAVWGRLKEVLSDREKLRGCVQKAVDDLEDRKHNVGAEVLALNERLEEVRAKKERLGIAFADGTVNESLYKQMLGKLNKQEAGLLKQRDDIDPVKVDGLATLEARISTINEFLEKGDFVVEDSGLYAVSGKQYLPLGFNAFRSTDGKVALSEIKDKDTVVNKVVWDVDPEEFMLPDWSPPPSELATVSWWETVDPQEFRETNDPEKTKAIVKNIRGVLQLFDIKVFVYDDKVEIKGTIPPQLIDLKSLTNSKATAPVISLGIG